MAKNEYLSSYMPADEASQQAFADAAKTLVKIADSRVAEQSAAVQSGPETKSITLQYGDTLFQVVRRVIKEQPDPEDSAYDAGDISIYVRPIANKQLENGRTERIVLPRIADAIDVDTTRHLMVRQQTDQLQARTYALNIMSRQLEEAQAPDNNAMRSQKTPEQELRMRDMLTAAVPNVRDIFTPLKRAAARFGAKPVAA